MAAGKINSVQYLRALAAALVVVAHAADHPLAVRNLDAARLGEFGVVLFFVISGYIMVAISGEGRFSALEFLRRRAIRIVPLYWIVTSVAAFLALMLPGLFKTTVFTWPHYLLSLLFIPHASPEGGNSPLLSLGWTLNYEVWFYICFAALGAVALRGRVVALTIFFTALAALGAFWRPGNATLDFYLDYGPLAFCVGCWIGYAHVSGVLLRLPKKINIALVVLALAGVIGAFVIGRDTPPDILAFIGFVLFAGSALALGLRVEMRLPVSHALVAIGDASYALYLTHMFVIGAAVAVAHRVLPVDNFGVYAAVVVVSVVASVAAGLVVHRLVELPLLRTMRGNIRSSAASTPQAA